MKQEQEVLKCSNCNFTGPIEEYEITLEEVICPNCNPNKISN